MQRPKSKSELQTAVSKDQRKALELSGMLKRPEQKTVSLEEMDEAVSNGAADQDI